MTGYVAIQPPTDSVSRLISSISVANSKLIMIGDKKVPAGYDIEHAAFWSLQAQLESEFNLARKLPVGHYKRKDIGYLVAIRAMTNWCVSSNRSVWSKFWIRSAIACWFATRP